MLLKKLTANLGCVGCTRSPQRGWVCTLNIRRTIDHRLILAVIDGHMIQRFQTTQECSTIVPLVVGTGARGQICQKLNCDCSFFLPQGRAQPTPPVPWTPLVKGCAEKTQHETRLPPLPSQSSCRSAFCSRSYLSVLTGFRPKKGVVFCSKPASLVLAIGFYQSIHFLFYLDHLQRF